MCNLNQVCGGLQKCHYSCCRQKMHNCFGKRYKPCCCCGDKLLDIDGTEQEAYPPLNWVLKCPLLQKTPNAPKMGGNRNSEYIKNVAKKRQVGKVAPQMNSTGKKISKVSPKTSSSLMNQDSQRNKGSCLRSNSKEEKLLSSSRLCACTSRKANSFKPVQKNQKPLEEKATKRKCRKQKPEQMENRRSLLKSKQKNKKNISSKMITRSTGGDADADGIWFDCNLPFRVNIPLPINMNSLFGSRSFSSKANSENCRALVPAGNIQEDRKLELPWLFDFTLTQAYQPPTLESNSLSSKSITFTRKKRT
ncbi:uncharacterized protein LOC108089533 [Drosophila ficusphila]|uniref:uncharacterized protein LOC108089533 n=1 Tax=Drosophila ficusphila TaxID=30025 RepID=UPI001C89BB17|nr:uncharacterized protein LOC108089533 [Drosophila ficusphila]